MATALRELPERTVLKALTRAQFQQIVQHDLLPDNPDGFVAEQIIFREIHVPDPGAAPRYKIIDKPRQVVTTTHNGIENFAMAMARGAYDHVDQDDEEDKWMAITVSRPSYIVLRLSPDEGDWTFMGSTTQAAVTMGRVPDPNNPPRLYGGLHYVTGTSVSPIPRLGCTVVYFAAMPAYGSEQAPYIQKMNYIADVGGGTINLFDPDVRYPGNGDS